MAALSPPADESARKIAALIFQRLARTGQTQVAAALGVSDSNVSRMKDEVPKFAGMLTALGLKVVPVEMQCYDEPTITAILTLARQRMAQLETVKQLAEAAPTGPTLDFDK